MTIVERQAILPTIREVTIQNYQPETIIQDLAKVGIVFDKPGEAYRCFLRTRDGKPLVSDYPSSTLSSVAKHIGQFGCEYDPIGQSIGTLKQPLMTYAVPHPHFGKKSNQVGFVIVYDTQVAPELFSSYATPVISDQNVHTLRKSVKAVYKINYQ